MLSTKSSNGYLNIISKL
uniref:Uncharacterized protein n=1 Tax=Arundo donax TaxID=35708 RepID=A0A0A9FHR9_ARUDO